MKTQTKLYDEIKNTSEDMIAQSLSQLKDIKSSTDLEKKLKSLQILTKTIPDLLKLPESLESNSNIEENEFFQKIEKSLIENKKARKLLSELLRIIESELGSK